MIAPVRTTARLGAAAALAAAIASGAAAETMGTEETRYPTTEFADDAKSAAVTVGNVTAGVSQVMRPDIDPHMEIPILNIIVDGESVLAVPGVGSGFDFVAAEASIVEIDPSNIHPEVYFTSYSGGAHCCNVVIVAMELGGEWLALKVGEFDGDGNYLADLDEDGLVEIATVDNRFLYTFDCYACSAAPLMVTTVRGGQVFDVSADPRYVPAHRDWLAQLESNLDPKQRWRSPGFLAGWVAAKIRIGEGEDAWRQLEANWDYASDAGEDVCVTGGNIDDCDPKNIAPLKFPERLRLFLEQTGYSF